MKTISILAGLLISSTALAGFPGSVDGHDRGNGGDALVCKNAQGQITSAHFFDLYEAQEKFGMTLVPPKGTTVDEKVLNLIDRVADLDPMRAKTMKLWYKTFNKESAVRPGITLVDIPDTGDAFWPKECDLAQLVVQTDLDLPLNPYRYTFSKDIWQLLDDNNKAATIVHELLWREARFARHKTSAAVRYFNGLFQSDGFKDLSYEEYIEIVQKLKLVMSSSKDGFPLGSTIVFDGLTFSVGPATFKITRSTFDFKEDNGYAKNSYLQQWLEKPLRTPPEIKVKEIENLILENRHLKFYGKNTLDGEAGNFGLLSYDIQKKTYTLAEYDGDGLQVSFDQNLAKKRTFTYRDNVFENIYSIDSYKEDRAYSLRLKNEQIVTYKNNIIYCKAMTPIIPWTDFTKTFSCVLSRDANLDLEDRYSSPKRIRVKAGTRVYMDRDSFKLIETKK